MADSRATIPASVAAASSRRRLQQARRSYAAANWICVGQTQGRGRNDRQHQGGFPVKTIWVYPLRADFRRRLCAATP
jgi:hypothetical protein